MTYTKEEYQKAQEKVKKKKEFYKHLTSFISTILTLAVINAFTSYGNWWFQYPMMGWGIAIISHYFSVFGLGGLNVEEEDWEDQAIEEELRKLPPKKKNTTVPDEHLELKEFKKLRNEWEDSDFV